MQSNAAYRVQAALGLTYLCAGSAKLLGAGIMVEAFDVAGLGPSLRIAVGVLEICGGLCLFIPRAAIYAAVVLGCTILGIMGAMVGHTAKFAPEPQPLGRPLLIWTTMDRAEPAGRVDHRAASPRDKPRPRLPTANKGADHAAQSLSDLRRSLRGCV
jgi:uncharacterized membrane protein YphA (DoxX/SURF4 family)